MARVYKEDGFLIIEGYGAIPIKRASYTLVDGVVTINDNTKVKAAFNARWQNVQDDQGNQLSDETTLQTYLTDTLTEDPLNIDGGIIF